jgi:hypothetical protein
MGDIMFSNLQSEMFNNIEGHDFEVFCGELLRFEVNYRHNKSSFANFVRDRKKRANLVERRLSRTTV